MTNPRTIQITDLNSKISDLVDGLESSNRSYIIMKNGVRVAILRPIKSPNFDSSDALDEKRRRALEKIEVLGKKIAKLWNSEEDAGEAVSNDRR